MRRLTSAMTSGAACATGAAVPTLTPRLQYPRASGGDTWTMVASTGSGVNGKVREVWPVGTVTVSGAAGANVNAVTKSGTNEFHGSVYGTYRDGDWFGDYPARVAGSTLDVTGLAFDEYEKEETYGVTFGGPLVKDKLFFFANYEKFKQTAIGPAGGSQGTNPLDAGADFDASDVAEVQRLSRLP